MTIDRGEHDPQRFWLQVVAALRTSAVLAEIACVCGFYSRLLFFDPTHLGLSPATAPAASFTIGLSRWLVFIGPRLLLGIGAGVIFGFLGTTWARSRALTAGIALGLPFLVEPFVGPIYLGFVKGPGVIWLAEAVVGAAIMVLAVRSWRLTASTNSVADR